MGRRKNITEQNMREREKSKGKNKEIERVTL
jgi:hypothetical protein